MIKTLTRIVEVVQPLTLHIKEDNIGNKLIQGKEEYRMEIS